MRIFITSTLDVVNGCKPCGQGEAVDEGHMANNEDADPLDAFMTDLRAPHVEQVL